MALKLEGEFTITLDEEGLLEGKLIDDGGTEHKIELGWSPKTQNLTSNDLIKIRKCQDALRDIAILYRLLMSMEG